MIRRVLVSAALLAAVLAGVAIGSRSPLAAQDSPPPMGITPVPGRHSEVRALYFFYFKATPNQLGWSSSEFKDEGQSFYKVDAAPGCGSWVVAPGTKPGLVLEPGGTNCVGFRVDFGEIYWFTVPPIVVVIPSPTQAASITPPPTPWATATGTSTPTPSPQGEVTKTPTPAPTGTPKIVYGNMCEPAATPVYPHSITIYGQGGLTAPAFYWWCLKDNNTPDLVIIVPEATYRAAYDDGPRQLLKSLGR